MNPRNLFFATVATLSVSLSIPTAAAQPAPNAAAPAATVQSTSPIRLGGDGGLVVPTSDWADITGVGVGISGVGLFSVGPQVAVIAHPGVVLHAAEEVGGVDFKTREVLLVGGVAFFPSPEVMLTAETGLNLWTLNASAGGQSDSETETRVPLIASGAYVMPSGVKIGAGIMVPNLLLTEDGEDTQVGFFANVGYLLP